MDKIVCLVGESGSGKTTIAELLEKEGYNYIQSYTTRLQRYEGEKGHIFVRTDAAYPYINKAIPKNKLPKDFVAYTFFDNAHYWATKEQYQGKGISIYVIDVAGVKELKERIKDAKIIIIYLKADESTRYKRMVKERGSESIDRIEHDKEVFKVIPCDYVVVANRDIKEVLEDVKEIIK